MKLLELIEYVNSDRAYKALHLLTLEELKELLKVYDDSVVGLRKNYFEDNENKC